ncbi:MAG: response regulator [Ruminiclostridium sp.]|nr:response regulator [Ruminiclostridium sp.]
MPKVLLINQGSEFMTESVVANLRKAGIEVVVVPLDVVRIGVEQFDTDVFLVYAGDYIVENHTAIQRLKEYCQSEEKPICAIGYEKDIATLEHDIPAQLIAHKFIRPFEVRTLADALIKIANADVKINAKRSILLVDDDAVYLKTVLKFLSGKYNVTAVRAGHHALKFLADHHPDLILLDYEMPMMSGPETLEKIRKKPELADIPVVFLSGVSDKETVLKVMQLRPDGYLLKNTGKDELLESIRNFFISKKWQNVK